MEAQAEIKPDWIKQKPAEIEKIVVELAKKGMNGPQIGVMLRDQHGIPKVKLLGKRISQILKENNIKTISEKDLMHNRIKSLEEHIANKKHDKNAKRSLIKKLWAVKKLN